MGRKYVFSTNLVVDWDEMDFEGEGICIGGDFFGQAESMDGLINILMDNYLWI